MNAKSVVKKQESQLATTQAPEGLEDLDANDVKIPRAKLLQGGSEQIKNPDDYPNLRVGMIVNNITLQELEKAEDNDKAYPFIPVKMFKSWCKFKEDMTLDVKTYDRNHPLATGEDAWQYKQLNFLGFQPETKQPIVFTFWKTSAKAGQDIINIAQLRQKPLYANLFYIGTKNAKTDNNEYRVFTVQSKGEPAEDLIQIGASMYQQFNALVDMMKNQKAQVQEDDSTPPWEE